MEAGAGDVRGDVGVEVVVVTLSLLSHCLCCLDGQHIVLVQLSHHSLFVGTSAAGRKDMSQQ